MAEAAESFADAVVRVEDETGIRAPWRVWPQMRHDSTKLGVPLSLVYTPLKAVANPYRASYAPVRCSGCSAVLSPFTYVDYQKKSYVCSFCSLMQPLPPAMHRLPRSTVQLSSMTFTRPSNITFRLLKRPQEVTPLLKLLPTMPPSLLSLWTRAAKMPSSLQR